MIKVDFMKEIKEQREAIVIKKAKAREEIRKIDAKLDEIFIDCIVEFIFKKVKDTQECLIRDGRCSISLKKIVSQEINDLLNKRESWKESANEYTVQLNIGLSSYPAGKIEYIALEDKKMIAEVLNHPLIREHFSSVKHDEEHKSLCLHL